MDCLERQGWKSRGIVGLHHDLESPVKGVEVERETPVKRLFWAEGENEEIRKDRMDCEICLLEPLPDPSCWHWESLVEG